MQRICSSTREEDPHLVAVAKAVPAMAERLRTTAATVEAGNAATVTALADLRAELAGVKASLQDFVQGRFSFTFTPVTAVSLAPPPPVSLGGQLPPAPPVMSVVESYALSYRLSREVYTIPDL